MKEGVRKYRRGIARSRQFGYPTLAQQKCEYASTLGILVVLYSIKLVNQSEEAVVLFVHRWGLFIRIKLRRPQKQVLCFVWSVNRRYVFFGYAPASLEDLKRPHLLLCVVIN